VKPYFGMFREELLDGRRFVRRKIIQDNCEPRAPTSLYLPVRSGIR